MTLPCRGAASGTTRWISLSGSCARSRTASSSFWPATVRLAATRTRGFAYSLAGSVGEAPVAAAAPAGCSTGAPSLSTPWTAPGSPYSYGPPPTVGTVSKLKIGGGEETCHSSVSARHGLAAARGPPRQLDTTL